MNRPARVQPASALARVRTPDPPPGVDNGPLPWLQVSWERRPPDDDFLVLRLGVGRRLARVELGGPHEDGGLAVPELAAAPVVVDLPRAGLIGLAGPAGETRAVARWLATQIAIWHAPSSVQLLTGPTGRPTGTGFGDCPHARGDGSGAPVSLIGNDATTCDDRIRALLKLLESRAAEGRDRFAGATSWSPPVVVILVGPGSSAACPAGPGARRRATPRPICWVAGDREAAPRGPRSGCRSTESSPSTSSGSARTPW